MSYKNPTVPLITNPVNLDAAIQDVQVKLANGLSWLDASFGRAYTGSRKVENKDVFYPEVYQGKKEYLDVSPNDNLIAQSFFDLKDPQEFERMGLYQDGQFTSNISIIFWMNLDRVKKAGTYTYSHRFTEELKAQILNVLKLHCPNFILNKIYEEADEVYRGYTMDHVKQQTLKHPFAGFRFEGQLIFNEQC